MEAPQLDPVLFWQLNLAQLASVCLPAAALLLRNTKTAAELTAGYPADHDNNASVPFEASSQWGRRECCCRTAGCKSSNTVLGSAQRRVTNQLLWFIFMVFWCNFHWIKHCCFWFYTHSLSMLSFGFPRRVSTKSLGKSCSQLHGELLTRLTGNWRRN